MSELTQEETISRGKLAFVGAIRLLLALVLLGGLLFWSAGTTEWGRGWLFLAILGMTFAFNLGFMAIKNPELMQERWKQRSDTKPFDKLFGFCYLLTTIAMLSLAGMDAVRYQWTQMSSGLLYVGLAIHLIGLIPVLGSMLANPHLETTVRIQDDRNHQVITGGPYRYVRHPMYTGIMLLYLGWPLILQSWVAFGVSWIVVLLLVIRIGLEEATLRQELLGYTEFCTQTRYRLVPGVW